MATQTLLKVGSRGSDVKAAQQYLKQLSTTFPNLDPGPLDGIFGSKTQAAVKAFQSLVGISQDGIIGPQTRTAMSVPVNNFAPSVAYSKVQGLSPTPPTVVTSTTPTTPVTTPTTPTQPTTPADQTVQQDGWYWYTSAGSIGPFGSPNEVDRFSAANPLPSGVSTHGSGRGPQGNVVNPSQFSSIFPAVSPTQTTPDDTGLGEFQQLYDSLSGYLDEILKRGQSINPYVEITPEKVSEFMAQAESEIDPFFSTQLKLAREGFLRSLGYTRDEIVRNEQRLEQLYGRRIREIGEQAAERGFAQSGIRRRTEAELAQDVQGDIDAERRRLAFETGGQARQFASTFSGLPGFSLPNIRVPETPTVVPGETQFQRTGRELPFYELSDNVFSGLVGTAERERQLGIREAAAGFEQSFKQAELARRTRNLIL